MSEPTALVVEDTDANRDFFVRLLKQAGFTTYGARTGQEALAIAEELGQFDVAVVDMEMPDMSGLQLTKYLRRHYPEACLIVATMHDEISLIESAFQRGCNVFMVKPHGFMELYQRLTTTGAAAMRVGPSLIIDHYGVRIFRTADNSG